MLSITFRDLLYRFRQFLIAVVGAGVVFAHGAAAHRAVEQLPGRGGEHGRQRRRRRLGAPDRVHRPLHLVRGPAARHGGRGGGDCPAWSRPTRSPSCRPRPTVDGEVRSLRLIGHRLGGLGTPEVVDGRSAEAPGEVGRRRPPRGGHRRAASTWRAPSSRSSGPPTGLSLLGGTPERVRLRRRRAVTSPSRALPSSPPSSPRAPRPSPPGELTVLSSDEVEADTVHAMGDAISSIDNSRALMWVVAAIIVAALMYVSSLERLRDFAVLKSLGSSSRPPLPRRGRPSGGHHPARGRLRRRWRPSSSSRCSRCPIVDARPVRSWCLPLVAIVVGLLSSLVALRRAISVDPSSAFAAAQ